MRFQCTIYLYICVGQYFMLAILSHYNAMPQMGFEPWSVKECGTYLRKRTRITGHNRVNLYDSSMTASLATSFTHLKILVFLINNFRFVLFFSKLTDVCKTHGILDIWCVRSRLLLQDQDYRYLGSSCGCLCNLVCAPYSKSETWTWSLCSFIYIFNQKVSIEYFLYCKEWYYHDQSILLDLWFTF